MVECYIKVLILYIFIILLFFILVMLKCVFNKVIRFILCIVIGYSVFVYGLYYFLNLKKNK